MSAFNFYSYPRAMPQPAQTSYQASGYGSALGAFGNYRGSMDALSAPFYPMLYGAFSQLLPQMGMDPYGAAVRAAQQPPMSPADAARQQYEESRALAAEHARQAAEQKQESDSARNAWLASDGYKQQMAGMSPPNRRIWDLMYRM